MYACACAMLQFPTSHDVYGENEKSIFRNKRKAAGQKNFQFSIKCLVSASTIRSEFHLN